MGEHELRQEIEFALAETSIELGAAIQQARSIDLATQLQKLLDRLNDIRLAVPTEDTGSLNNKIRSLSSEIEGVYASFAASGKDAPGYGTNTFKCHSDFELCFKQATSVPEKTLCYALFARCIVKG